MRKYLKPGLALMLCLGAFLAAHAMADDYPNQGTIHLGRGPFGPMQMSQMGMPNVQKAKLIWCVTNRGIEPIGYHVNFYDVTTRELVARIPAQGQPDIQIQPHATDIQTPNTRPEMTPAADPDRFTNKFLDAVLVWTGNVATPPAFGGTMVALGANDELVCH